MRRAFADFRIRGKDDADYVSKAMQWYQNEKDGLVVNPGCTLNEASNGAYFTMTMYEMHPDRYDNPPTVRDPLFKRSTGSATSKGALWLTLLLAIDVLALVRIARCAFSFPVGHRQRACGLTWIMEGVEGCGGPGRLFFRGGQRAWHAT